MKKISIISPVYNPGGMLRKNLESVLRQDYSNIEHVVVDGGSNDGSLDILKEYEKKYEEKGKKLIWISEKDNGISDAVNKGTAMSSGDIITFMIDVYANNSIVSEIMENFENNDIDYLFGGLLYQKNGKIIRRWSGKPGNWHFGFMMATPTLCYTKEVWEKRGPFVEKYVVDNDYDFHIKLLKDKSFKFKSIKKPLVIYYAGGISNGSVNRKWFAIKEGYTVAKDNKAPFPAFTALCKIMIAIFAYLFASRKSIELEEWMK